MSAKRRDIVANDREESRIVPMILELIEGGAATVTIVAAQPLCQWMSSARFFSSTTGVASDHSSPPLRWQTTQE